MKTVELTLLAHNDMEELKAYLLREFGERTAGKVLGEVYDDMGKLSAFPEMGKDILAEYGIASDYLCLVTHKNYVFYRIEDNFVRIIRVLDERRDFLRVLFGIPAASDESEEYWDG